MVRCDAERVAPASRDLSEHSSSRERAGTSLRLRSHTARVDMKDRLSRMQLRSCNEETGEIEHTRVRRRLAKRNESQSFS